MILTLCYRCATVFIEDDTRIIYRVDYKQLIKEPCMCCKHPGLDYEVRDKVNKNVKSVFKEDVCE